MLIVLLLGMAASGRFLNGDKVAAVILGAVCPLNEYNSVDVGWSTQ